jgi:hypothetical protein
MLGICRDMDEYLSKKKAKGARITVATACLYTTHPSIERDFTDNIHACISKLQGYHCYIRC